jgi:hypothetical protein
MPYDSSASAASVSDRLCAVLRRAGVLPSSAIRVVGASGLHALLWLCRHGYQRAALMQVAAPAEPADVVLVPSTCRPETLDLVLAHAAHLSPDGLLVLHMRHGAPGAEARLRAHGFTVEQRLSDTRRDLYIARSARAAVTGAGAGP